MVYLGIFHITSNKLNYFICVSKMKAHIAKAGLEIHLFAVLQGQRQPLLLKEKKRDVTGHVYTSIPHKLSLGIEIFINYG